MNSREGANRLGLRLESCGDGAERVVEIGPTGRIPRATKHIALGGVILTIAGQSATQVKVGLSAGTLALPTSEFAITFSVPGETEPATITIPALDEDAPEQFATALAETPHIGADLPDEITEPEKLTDLESIIAASYGKTLSERPEKNPKPYTASPIAPASTLPNTPTAQLDGPTTAPSAAAIDFRQPITPERAWADYLRMRRSDEPGNALGPGAASACGEYDPFWDLQRRF
jgi:hypothetical protein